MRQILILVCLFASPLLLGCETQVPPTPVGGGCQYRDIPGTCRIETITPSGPNTYGEGFRTLFLRSRLGVGTVGFGHEDDHRRRTRPNEGIPHRESD